MYKEEGKECDLVGLHVTYTIERVKSSLSWSAHSLTEDLKAICNSHKAMCKSHLTSGASVRPENTVVYSAGSGGQTICGVFFETAPFKSYGVKRKLKSQLLIRSSLLWLTRDQVFLLDVQRSTSGYCMG